MHFVLTTFGTEESAAPAIRQLVAEKLAGCGTILPGARSIYMWEGKLEDAAEVLVLLKTTRPEDLAKRLAEIHPYDVPEIATIPAGAITPAYERWLASHCETSPGSADR